VEKLNKKQEGVYVIEEEKDVANGIWEGYLNHDNVNHETIYIYTGPKLTGEKVENYFISTPSETPWKTHLKVFSNSEKIYITYETTGDQVEAEDINLLQDSLVEEIDRAISEENRIDKKLDNEIVRAITEDEKLNEEVEDLKETKADKTYVDTELNKKYNKDEVFTKEEVLQKIEEIIDAAPEALDTLGKLAEALDNDPNFATNIINLLSAKVDKVAGKGLSTNDYTNEEKQKLAGIEKEANKYTHPTTHSANMIVETSSKRFVSDVEKAEWNDAVEHIEDNIRHITEAERDKWNTVESKAELSDIPTKISQLTNDKNYVTQDDLGSAGYGDMLKSIYDTNNNGKVDIAELADKVPWNGVTNKPNTFTPSSHTHSISNVTGLQNALDNKMEKGPLTWNDLKGV
jgi:hypothetical protein